jgi:transposase
MTKKSRRKIDAAQKAKVALKALRKQATESELAQQL